MRAVQFKTEETAHITLEDGVLKCTICDAVYKPRRRVRFHKYKWKVNHVRCKFPNWGPVNRDMSPIESKRDDIAGFEGSFDYSTISGLVRHLRKAAKERAGGSAGESTYDPELLCLLTDAAEALEKLRISRNSEHASYLTACSVAERRRFEIADLEAEIEALKSK